MEYLLKANAIIILFYLCYKLFLQGETFFESNRYFLLAGLVVASSIPFIVIPIYVDMPKVVSYNFSEMTAIPQTEVAEAFNFLKTLEWTYILGAVIFSIKFLIEFIALSFVLINNKRKKQGKYTFIETKKDHSPFSFFKYIVYNPNHFSVNELEHIILHEEVHAKQYHSVDILLTKLAAILFWFNPFIWLYNKSLQQNLEFIADNETQSKVSNAKHYQTLLLKTVLSKDQMRLVNNFYNSLIKKRIIMLHKSKSKQSRLWKYTLVLPLLALFLMSFNTEKVYKEISSTQSEEPEIKEPKMEDVEEVIISKEHSKKKLKELEKHFLKFDVELKFKGVKRNKDGEITAIKASFKSPEGSKGNYSVHGSFPIQAFAFFYNSKNGEVGFNRVKEEAHHKDGNHHSFITKKGKHKVHKTKSRSNVFVHTIDDDHEEHEDSKDHKDSEEHEDHENVKFTVKKGKHKKHESKSGNNVFVYSSSNDDKHKVKKIVRKGKKRKGSNEEDIYIIKEVDTEVEIDTEVEVDTNHNVEKEIIIKEVNGHRNTWKEEGKETIIELDGDKNKFFISSDDMDNPIWVKDGKVISKKEFEKINPDDIMSINVFKGKTATAKYGKKAKGGAIEVTTKK